MENKLVEIQNNQVVVSSRQIAEHFDKQHKHVLGAIENIKAENSAVTSMFCETTYTAGTGKAYKEYLMNRDGFSLLVMGFTGKKALEWKIKYIEAFNKMEEKLKSQIPSYQITDEIERAKRWIEEAEERRQLVEKNEVLEKELEEARPKVEYCDLVFQSPNTVTASVIAKEYGMTACELNTLLYKLGFQYKLGNCWYITNKYAANGYIKYETITKKDKKGEPFTITYMKWTHLGRIFIYNKLKEKGIIPLIERID